METRPTFTEFWSRKFASSGGQPVTECVSRRIGGAAAFVGYKLNLHPNVVTLSAFALTVLTAIGFVLLPDTVGFAFIILVGYQLGYALDCADGALARASGKGSAFGGWLDVALDFGSNFAVVGALLFVYLDRGGSIALHWILGVTFFLIYAKSLALWTSNMRKKSKTGRDSDIGRLRLVARFALDNATFLLVVSIGKLFPMAIPIGMLAYGILFLIASMFLTRGIQ